MYTKLYKVFIGFIDRLSFFMIAALFIGSLFVSRGFNFDEFHESGLEVKHNPIISFLLAAGFIILLYLLYRAASMIKIERNAARFSFCFILVCGILTLVMGLLWVTYNPFYPRADQARVWKAAVSLASGTDIGEDDLLYYDMYPRQKGMAVLLSLIARIHGGDVDSFRCFNAILVSVSVIFILLCLREASGQIASVVPAGILLVAFLPLCFYSSFVYGTIAAIALPSVSLYGLIRYYDSNKPLWLVPPILLLPISYIAYQATAIFIIAFVVVLVCEAICSNSGRYKWILPLSTIIGIILFVVILESACSQIFDSRLGKAGLGDGTTTSAQVAMGLEYGEDMHFPGGHNGTDEKLYNENGRDSHETDKAARQLIRAYLVEYIKGERPRVFFVKKTEYQWLDPWFSALSMTVNDVESDDEEWNVFFYGGFFPTLEHVLYVLMVAVYLGAAYCQFTRIRCRETGSVLSRFPNIYFIGGFIFQLMWEQKARYCLPYFIALIPLATQGIMRIPDIWLYQQKKDRATGARLTKKTFIIYAIALILISLPLFYMLEERLMYHKLEVYMADHAIPQDISVSYVKGTDIRLNPTDDPNLYLACLPAELREADTVIVDFSRFRTLDLGGTQMLSGTNIAHIARDNEGDPITMRLYAPKGELLFDGWVKFLYLDDTPTMHISTYEEGAINIVDDTEAGAVKPHADSIIRVINGNGEQEEISDAELFRHGNSTFDNYDPKSYNLTLGTSRSILGMPPGRKWVLKANSMDCTQIIRNEMAFEASRMSSLIPSPASAYVNLYINGIYHGLYLFSQRVDAYELMGFRNEGEYLLEQDARYKRQPCYFILDDKGIVIKYPNPVSTDEVGYIKSRMEMAKSAILEGEGYEEYIDIDSFVRMYVIQDFFAQTDIDFSSLYFYMDGNGVFHAGPVWDFDLSCGYTSSGPYHEELALKSRLFDSSERICAILTDLGHDERFMSEVRAYYLGDFQSKISEYMSGKWDEKLARISQSLDVSCVASGIYETGKPTLDIPDELRAWIIDRNRYLISYYTNMDDYVNVDFHFAWGSVVTAVKRGESIGFLPDDDHEGNDESFWGEIIGFKSMDGTEVTEKFAPLMDVDVYAVYDDAAYAWEEYELPWQIR